MPNRETFPSALFPLRGDLNAEAGATSVIVTGIQKIPVSSSTPSDQNVLTFEASTGQWTPSGFGDANESIRVEGVVMSDDYDLGIELSLGTTNSPVLVEGV